MPTWKLSSAKLLRTASAAILWRCFTLLIATGSNIWAIRCLGPENLGISGFILTGVQQAVLLICLLPDSYLIRVYKNAPNQESADSIVRLASSIRFWATVSFMAVILLGVTLIQPPPEWKWAILAGIPLLMATALQPQWLIQAKEQQSIQYKVQFIGTFVSALCIALFFRSGVSASTHVLVIMLAGQLSLHIAWQLIQGTGYWNFLKFPSRKTLSAHFKNAYILYLTSLLVYVYVNLEVPLVGYLLSVEDLGIYRSAHSLIKPINAFLAMIPVFMYPRFIIWRKEGDHILWMHQKRLFRYCLAFAVLSFALVFLLSPLLYPLIFGQQFAQAAMPFAILYASKTLVILNGIFAWGLWSQSKDKSMLLVCASVAIISLGLNLLFIPSLGIIGAAWINLSSETLVLILTWILSRNAAKQSAPHNT